MKKRYWIAGFAALLLLGLMVVFLPRQEKADHVTFYYAQKNFAYGHDCGVMAPEYRAVGRRSNDYPDLLALYLEGPLDPALAIPFRDNRSDQVQTVVVEDDVVNITLADLGVGMTDSQFTLSCACLSRTCLEITGASRVNITSGERSVSMTRENMLLRDDSASTAYIQREEEK